MRRLSARISFLSVWSACCEGHSSIAKFLRLCWQIVTKGDFTDRSWRNCCWAGAGVPRGADSWLGGGVAPLLRLLQGAGGAPRPLPVLIWRRAGHQSQQFCGSASRWCGSGCGSGFDLSSWCRSGSWFFYLMRIRIWLFTLMWVRIRIQILKRLKPLKKCYNRLIFHTYILAWHLQIDADSDSDFYLMRIRIRIRIQITKMMQILPDNTVTQSVTSLQHADDCFCSIF